MRRPQFIIAVALLALIAGGLALWAGSADDDTVDRAATTSTSTAPPPPPTTTTTTTAPPAVSACDPTAWPDGAMPDAADAVVVERDLLLDCDLTVGALRIEPGASLVWVGDVELTVDASAGRSGRVEVLGTLTMQPEVGDRHVLTLSGVDATEMVGSDAGMMSDPGGVHVMGSGRLDLDGPDRTSWTRLAAPARAGATELTVERADGWRVGDELTVTPSSPPTEDDFATAYQDVEIVAVRGRTVVVEPALVHDAVGVDGLLPEVLNLTRDVEIRTGTGSPGYVVFHPGSGVQHLADAAFVGLGPDEVEGRYPLHLHLLGDDARGSTFDRLLVLDSGNRAVVPHGSHGTTWTDVVAHRIRDDAFWWDPGLDADASHDTVWHRAVASSVTESERSRFRLTGFELGSGDGNVLTDSVAVGVQGRKDAAGFAWLEGATRGGTGEWEFRGNVAHNNARHGVFTWQNTGGVHDVESLVAWHNGGWGVSHGAYRNGYHYDGLDLIGNGAGGVLLHALSREPGLRLTDVTVRRSPVGIGTTRHVRPSDDPTVIDGLDVIDVDVPLSGAARDHPDSVDVFGYEGPPVVYADDAHPDSEWRFHGSGEAIDVHRP